MDTIKQCKEMYDIILEVNFDLMFENEDFVVNFEEYRLRVDIAYRFEHNTFPVGDPDMEERLDGIAERIALEYLENQYEVTDENFEEEEEFDDDEEMEEFFEDVDEEYYREENKKSLREQFLNNLETFLKQKSKMNKQVYPQTRRFKRKDVWLIQRIDFVTNQIDSQDAYMEIFEELLSEGYYRLVETGGDPKHDVFTAVQV